MKCIHKQKKRRLILQARKRLIMKINDIEEIVALHAIEDVVDNLKKGDDKK